MGFNQAKFRDGLNFAQKLTFRRVENALRNVISYIFSRFFGRNQHLGLPISISIEPTTSCNLRCPECPSGLRSFTRPTGMLNEILFKQILDEISDKLLYLIFYFQGEPYLHPKFLDFVKYAANKKIYTATSTNAHYLTDDNAKKTVESGLDRLIISIDGTTQEVYEQYRVGGSLNKVIEGTKHVIKWKKELNSSTPYVIFQFLVVKPNEHQLENAKKMANELGVDDIVFKTAQIYDYEEGSDLIPTIDHYSRYKKLANGKYQIKNKLLNHCWKMWHSCVVTFDGLIVPCCFDKDAKYRLGDLKQKSFKAIWRSDSYQNFRNSLMKSRGNIEMCKNCSEGTNIWG